MTNPAKRTKPQPPERGTSWPGALRIVVIYLLIATVWIVASDRAVQIIAQNRAQASRLQSLKGVIFVTLSAGMLYGLLRRAFGQRDAAQERFETVARASNDAIYEWNVKTNYIWWSEGFQHLFGYPKDEFEPTLDFWTKCLHPDDRNRVMVSLKEGLVSGKTWSMEYRFQRKDGTYAHVYDQGVVLLDTLGRPARMLGGMVDISERKLAGEQLELSRRQLRALSARLQQLREEERTYISREIHDELGQMLTGIKMDLHWVQKRVTELPGEAVPAIVEKITDACELADKMIDCVQRISTELRPDVLDHLGLATAIKYEAQRFEKRTGIRMHLRVPESVPQITAAVGTAIFRVFQELLTNVARHAEAAEVRVDLSDDGQYIHLVVRDNGKGITPEALANPRSLGLLGMRERVSLLGGRIAVERSSPQGTVASVQIPISASDLGVWELV